APREIALHQSPMHLVETDKIDIGTAQIFYDPIEETRRHLKQAIRLEPPRSRRPHVVQRQDSADTAKEWREPAMRAGEIQRLQPATDQRRSECSQGTLLHTLPLAIKNIASRGLIILCRDGEAVNAGRGNRCAREELPDAMQQQPWARDDRCDRVRSPPRT